MPKPLRRIIMLLLTTVIVAAVPMTAGAQPESQEKSMETALIAVKSLIDIDDDVFTDFNYGSSYSNYETREGLIWSFQWSDAKNAYISAVAAADGTLLQYNKYRYDGRSFGFAEIDRTTAITKSDAFIKNANPDTFSYYKEPADIYVNLHNSDYNLVYYAEVNGYAFEAAQITVSINKFSGEITGYYTRNVDPGRFKFENATGIISQSDYVAAYADKMGLSLEYRSYFDYENSNLTVFPVYMLNSSWNQYIGAKTGGIVEYVYDLGSDYLNASTGSANAPSPEAADQASGGSRASLTPAEKAAIEQVAGFLTSEQALQKLLQAADLTELDIGAFTDQYIGLNRNYLEKDRYYYDIYAYKYLDYYAEPDEITGISGRVDAVTGRVLSFNYNYNGMLYSNEEETYTAEQAASAVDAFLKRIAPAELAKTRLEGVQIPKVDPYGYVNGFYYYDYVRYENDVPFRDNGINVTYNQRTGKITSYSLNWYNNVSFPGISNILTQQKAFDAYVAQTGSKIGYITTGNGNATLVYDLQSRGWIDPFTGKALDYSGTPLTGALVIPSYDDIAGHWSERYVKKLLENGIYMWSGRFEPDKVMTELEFLQYIMLIEPYYYASTEPQMFFAQRGIAVEASADKKLTRQEAARIITEYLGYGKLAGQPEWFIYPFTDSVDAAYKGYITICYMLGIVGGDSGRFNAMSYVTRADAAGFLHNLILAQSK